MKMITVGRHPCRAGVTDNVLEYAAGALNIDATRLGAGEGGSQEGESTKVARYTQRGSTDFAALPGPRGGDARGRWPANVMLCHEEGCVLQGAVPSSGYTINRWSDGAKPFGGGAGHPYEGIEVCPQVECWDCVEGCVARRMDAQSGTTATHFFKQVQGMASKIPEDLIWYLAKLIAPPADCVPLLILEPNLSEVDWASYGDATVHGLITVGDPSRWLEQMDRVLRPGAHVLLISDEEDPTGATGACAIEDYGFEIRDAIAVLDQEDDFTYAAKPSSRERHDGVIPRDRILKESRLFPCAGEDLASLREELAEMIEDLELLRRMETEGLPVHEVPEDMRESFELREVEIRREIRNDHATVKSVALMRALLRGTPDGALVVDPFMGSGTTGIACVLEGYDFVGIEMERDSLTISDQRIQHWDRKMAGWDGAVFESEAVPFEHESDPVRHLNALFGADD